MELFKIFQKQWIQIDKTRFKVGDDSLFNSTGLLAQRHEMYEYYSDAIEIQQPRDDYHELLMLCRYFLAGANNTDIEFKFRAPGACHRARWISKAIYCIKMYMFQHQLNLSETEIKSITEMSLFISLVYGRYWNESPISIRAPLNDAKLFEQLESYPNRKISAAGLKAVHRHLWYFSEYLIGLAFFDSRVTFESKRNMVKNLQLPPKDKAIKRCDGKEFNHRNNLEHFVTKRTYMFFDLLVNDGQERAISFLTKDPILWKDDKVYVEMEGKARFLKVVNDCAERGIALVNKFNSSITKNEEQKQYLLRLVDLHRKKYPTSSKTNIEKMNANLI